MEENKPKTASEIMNELLETVKLSTEQNAKILEIKELLKKREEKEIEFFEKLEQKNASFNEKFSAINNESFLKNGGVLVSFSNEIKKNDSETKKTLSENKEALNKITAEIKNSISEAKNLKVNADLHPEAKNSIKAIEKLIKPLKWWAYAIYAIPLFLFVFSVIYAFKFYKESVRTEKEFRENIEKKGEKIVNEKEYNSLKLRDETILEWMGANPKDGKKLTDWIKKEKK